MGLFTIFSHAVQVSKVKMPYCAENVCIELDNESTHLYAIGSRSHISFVDDRLSDKVTSVRSLDKDCGKKSKYFILQIFVQLNSGYF